MVIYLITYLHQTCSHATLNETPLIQEELTNKTRLNIFLILCVSSELQGYMSGVFRKKIELLFFKGSCDCGVHVFLIEVATMSLALDKTDFFYFIT